ncbi:MAG: ubiquinol-cytochrome C chaperone family protein [Alphaproteobacteria bacterium]|nr:ubiquinol-cytochrome C chaperone family protein [Alphaproteobacteria bacterium]
MALRPAWQAEEVGALYRTVADHARQPIFYLAGGVPDSLDGRFDLLSLHLILLMRRLRGHGREGHAMQQALFDLLAADMDRNLREMGVGDTGISRRVKAMGEAFFGRYTSYDTALCLPATEQQAALMTALDKNLYGTVPSEPARLECMAGYARVVAADLERQSLNDLLRGQLTLMKFEDKNVG